MKRLNDHLSLRFRVFVMTLMVFFAILSLQKFIFRVNFRLTRQHFCVKCTGIMRSHPPICPISLICFFGADTCIFVKDDPCKKTAAPS